MFFIKILINDFSKSEISDSDNIINSANEKKSIKYISNGIELKSNYLTHYWNILDMTKERKFNRDMIFIQVQKCKSFLYEDNKLGYKTKYSINDIKMSEDYITNHYDYIMNLN